MKIFNFELGKRLDQYFEVKLDEESEFYSFEADKSSRDPLKDPLWGPNMEIF